MTKEDWAPMVMVLGTRNSIRIVVSYLVHYDTILKNATDIITKCDKSLFQCVRFLIIKCDNFITKCKGYYKMQQFYYKMRLLLQNALVHRTSFFTALVWTFLEKPSFVSLEILMDRFYLKARSFIKWNVVNSNSSMWQS